MPIYVGPKNEFDAGQPTIDSSVDERIHGAMVDPLPPFWPGLIQQQTVWYRSHVSEPSTFRGDIVVGGDKFHFKQSSGRDTDVHFSCDTETLALMLSGRLVTSCVI